MDYYLITVLFIGFWICVIGSIKDLDYKVVVRNL